jgi:hypothetical protein
LTGESNDFLFWTHCLEVIDKAGAENKVSVCRFR